MSICSEHQPPNLNKDCSRCYPQKVIDIKLEEQLIESQHLVIKYKEISKDFCKELLTKDETIRELREEKQTFSVIELKKEVIVKVHSDFSSN